MMADPPVLGPRKAVISRTRTGCHTCRTRRRKCDQAKPECANCVRLGFKCEGYGVKLRWTNEPKGPEISAASTPSANGARRILLPKARSDASATFPLRKEPAITSPVAPGNLQFVSSFPPESGRGESLLLHHFVTHVETCLAPFSQHKNANLWLHPFLRPAIMSLSAANLHQLYLIQEHGSSGHMPVSADTQTTTTYGYKRQAISMYATAIKALSTAVLEKTDSVGLYLTATLLLSLFEWDFGSAGSYFVHLDGADTLVSLGFEDISKFPQGPSILQSWARMHRTRLTRQLPFRPLEREKPLSHQKIAQLSNQVLDGSAILSALVADAFSLRNRLVLQTCFEALNPKDQSVLQFWRNWYSRVFGFPYVSETYSHSMEQLDKPGLLDALYEDDMRLRAWRRSLPTTAEPIVPQIRPNDDVSSQASVLPRITSWVFPRDGDALQYLGYLMGRILSSREIIDRYLLEDYFPSSVLPLHPLVMDVFTVIEALDPETTIAHDTYGNGPLWIFGALSTCVPDLRVVSYLLYTVMPRFRRFAKCGPLLEIITKECQIITCVKSELEKGRSTFLCDPDIVLTDDIALDESSLIYIKMAVVGRGERGFYRDLVDVGLT